MTFDVDGLEAPSLAQSLMRLAVLAIGGAEIIAFSLYAGLMLSSSDPMGSAIGSAMTLLMGAPIALLVLPAVYLAWMWRLVPLALVMVVLAPLINYGLWLIA
jgi:hypothetical protein